MTPIEIDGSMLEGGGQILRIATALSAVTLQPVRIINIRASRKPPGLRPQHLTAVEAVGKLVDADMKGVEVGSQTVAFTPHRHVSGNFEFDTGTAGSTTLILQALMPVATFSIDAVKVRLKGGTNNPWAPPVEYLQEALLPNLRMMGLTARVDLVKRGFYPVGGGIVDAEMHPVHSLKPIDLKEFGNLKRIWGICYSCRLPPHIVDRMSKAACDFLVERGVTPPQITKDILQSSSPRCSLSPGCGIILLAQGSGGSIVAADALGEVGKPAEEVGGEAAGKLVNSLTGAPVDEHMADQLIIWMSLAKGESHLTLPRLTMHALTAIEVCRRMLKVTFQVDGELNKPAQVKCRSRGGN